MTQTILVQKKDGRRRPHSEEHKAKISASWTPERRAEQSAKMKTIMTGENNSFFGKKHTEEARAKQSAAATGRIRSKESCAKQGAAISGKNNVMNRPEVRAKFRGKNNSSWRGGISFEPYCIKFNSHLKEQYRNLYGRVCGYCGKSEFENGERLSVHHIDGNRNQGCDRHDWFLVPLCRSCNSKGFERKPEYVFLFWLKDIERKHRRLRQ